MKRLMAVLLVLCLMLSLGGCWGSSKPDESAQLVRVQPLEGEPREPDVSGLKHYETENGIGLYAVGSLKESETEAMALYMSNNYFLVLVIQEPKAGTVLEDTDLEGYASMLADTNGLEPFVRDVYGSLATVNLALMQESEDMFFYYVTVHETADSFWLVQVACPDEFAEFNLEQMALWSATFTFPEA